MARTSWLDESNDNPTLDSKVQELESFASAMADGKVDKDELARQEARLVAVMKEVEPKLDDAQHEAVTKLLVELSAYDIMRTLHELQVEHLRRSFSS
ncbi:MAG: hypothetical protein AAF368_03180 [Planctomycetota bacterium]